ncbi:type II toxin-antitoxin system RelE family toxin [Cuniculiplasma divulgatum]|uniref:RelE toxin n=1 Tax=Cuniculiplasma divulgatum TaxID=1673428 RepID=A0A1N5WHF7_9ARCH|nr:type II toxin-antitoxin system RelE/ParE family toxin [Cuniculiplasma divulgatum]SIM84708.1 RelE toxin [Cuniculiplasma divulgatum]
MTNFEVEFSEESLFQLRGMDIPLAKRIIQKIESTRSDPHRFFVRLVGRTEYKLRVGDYRVIADIEENRRVIVVRSLGHRRNIYK